MWQRSNAHEQQDVQESKANPTELAKNSVLSVSTERKRASCVTDWHFECSYSIYLTETYTESYSYPLITYLHEGYNSEKGLWDWFPGISDQNYLAAGVRAPFPHPRGLPYQFDWKLRRPDASMAAIRDTVQSIDEHWNINPERIYLFGEGEGAVVALQHLVLQQTLEYDSIFSAGVICKSLPTGWAEWLPHIENQLHGRVLILDPVRDPSEHAVIDAFSEAGLEIMVADASESLTPQQLINQWVMAGINTAIY